MVYSVARQERYIKTGKGKAAKKRSDTKNRRKSQNKLGGRLELRLKKIRATKGEKAAIWFEEQKPMCKICVKNVHKAPSVSVHKQDQAVIDHDHSTGKLRGLLCHQCNVGLGNFKDSIYLLFKAMLYLLWNRIV